MTGIYSLKSEELEDLLLYSRLGIIGTIVKITVPTKEEMTEMEFSQLLIMLEEEPLIFLMEVLMEDKMDKED